MGRVVISIIATGPHDNRLSTDIERCAQRAVDEMIAHGSTVTVATAVTDAGSSHELATMDRRVDDRDARAREAYERYRAVRIALEVTPKKIPPLWDDLDAIKQNAWYAATETKRS